MYRWLGFIVLVFPLAVRGGVKTGQLVGFPGEGLDNGLYEIDIESGGATLLHQFSFDPGGGALAVHPDGTLYATFSGALKQLATIDIRTGGVHFIGSTAPADVSGIEFGSDGELYGYDSEAETLVTVALNSGRTQVVQYLPFGGGEGGIASGSGGILLIAGHGCHPADSIISYDISQGELGTLMCLSPESGIGNILFVDSISAVGQTIYASAELETDWDSQVLFSRLDPLTGLVSPVGPFSSSFACMHGMAFVPGAGDVDRDGDVDQADYDIFVGCYTGPINDPEAEPLPVGCVFLDSDDDNDIDCLDWEAFIINWTEDEPPPIFETCDCAEPPCEGPCGGEPTCEGDANCDDTVDPLDAGFIQARFNCAVNTGDTECDAADVNADGVVDPLDVGYVLARFGSCP